MSLDFDYKDCGKTPEENAALSTHPADAERWHPVGDSLVWLSLICGFSRITKDTVDKIWERVDLYQRVSGGAIYGFAVDGGRHDLLLDRSDVERYVGLRTNASPKTDAQFYATLKGATRSPATKQSAFDYIAERHAEKAAA